MPIIRYAGWYNTNLCKQAPEFVFVFGDNLRGIGKGGQAIIRHEPNAYGVPTKRLPSMAEGSFFEEGNNDDLNDVLDSIAVLWGMLEEGRTIVVPVTTQNEVSLGLERAELRQRAPDIYDTIVMHFKEMGAAYGVTQIASKEALLNLR